MATNLQITNQIPKATINAGTADENKDEIFKPPFCFLLCETSLTTPEKNQRRGLDLFRLKLRSAQFERESQL
jgi:hypothetical protein